jgi:hypothetical protein
MTRAAYSKRHTEKNKAEETLREAVLATWLVCSREVADREGRIDEGRTLVKTEAIRASSVRKREI